MNFWQSLTGRLFKLVFGSYVILAIAVTAIQLSLEYARTQQMIASDLISLGSSFDGGVSGAMWEMDRLLLNTMARGIAQSSIVTGVSIVSENGKTFASVGETPDTALSDSGALLAPFQFNTSRLTRQTPTGERDLGQLTIYSSRSVALERVKYSFVVILINSLVKTAGLWLIFYIVISRILLRPLSKLTGIVSRLEFAADSKERISLDYPHQDELGRLMGAMGKMQERLFTARDELEKSNLRLEETVTERTKHLADALAFNETILINSPIPMGVYAASGQCVLVNDAFVQFFGATREALLAQNFNAIASWQQTSLLGDCLTALAHQTPQQREANRVTAFGKELWFEYRILPTKLNGNDHLLIQLFDLTERKRIEGELRHLATHDRLTKLPNRELFYDRLSQSISLARRKRNHLAVFFLDLDGFKAVNDSFGHEVGDATLRECARRLQSCIRDADTLARLGGDEFAIILNEIGTDSDAQEMSKKILISLSAPMNLTDGREYSVGISIGIAMYPESGSEIDSLITAADNAMYQSKSLGKNRFTLHQTESRSQVSTKSWLEFGAAHMVGIAEIDAQHQAIATMLNRLNDSLRNSEPQEGLVQQLEGVVASVATHFETEEDLMAQSDYPDAQSHMIQHKRLLAEVEHLKLRFLEGGELLALQWLKDWFFGHILGSDIQFGSFLAKLEPKAHPET